MRIGLSYNKHAILVDNRVERFAELGLSGYCLTIETVKNTFDLLPFYCHSIAESQTYRSVFDQEENITV
jgi:hypothetical protein